MAVEPVDPQRLQGLVQNQRQGRLNRAVLGLGRLQFFQVGDLGAELVVGQQVVQKLRSPDRSADTPGQTQSALIHSGLILDLPAMAASNWIRACCLLGPGNLILTGT